MLKRGKPDVVYAFYLNDEDFQNSRGTRDMVRRSREAGVKVNEIISSEWQRVKEAVRSSPAAREAFRKYLERTVSEQVEKLMKEDRTELESLGVVEKSL